MTILLWTIVVVLFVLGFAGLVVPVLPDTLLLLAGFVVYHFFVDSGPLTPSFWWTSVVVSIVIFAVDYVASGIGARKYGASKWSIVSAMLGLIIFPFVLGPIGILVGPFVMVVLTELLMKKSLDTALKIGFGTLIGFLGGVFVKTLLMVGLVVWFVMLVV